jgi:large subunit ribosomal protein L5e
LITQDKTKFAAPKYRFVVRITNRDVITQVVSSKIIGDQVLCAAYSHELPRYGLKIGLTNYAAAYATGLLLARRLLQKIGLDKKYVGVTASDGGKFLVQHSGGARPFRANADVGLARTTTGARIFGAIKGACDGGLYIPHTNTRFPGYNKEAEEVDCEVHRQRIYGIHVANYMKLLKESDEQKYQKQFSRFIKEGVTSEKVEDLYKKVHAAIRANPAAVKKQRTGAKPKRYQAKKMDNKTRKERATSKKARILKAKGAAPAATTAVETKEAEDDE